MHEVISRRIPFKKIYTSEVKWYTIYGFWTIEEFVNDITQKIQEDFQLDTFEFVMAGQNNEINDMAEEGFALYPGDVRTCEDVFGKHLNVCFYIRPY